MVENITTAAQLFKFGKSKVKCQLRVFRIQHSQWKNGIYKIEKAIGQKKEVLNNIQLLCTLKPSLLKDKNRLVIVSLGIQISTTFAKTSGIKFFLLVA